MTTVSDVLDAIRYFVSGSESSPDIPKYDGFGTAEPRNRYVELEIGGRAVIPVLGAHTHQWEKEKEYEKPGPDPRNPITLSTCSVEGCEAEQHKTRNGEIVVND